MFKFILLLLISFSICAQVKYIDKDAPAPYNGFLFTIKKTKEIRKELIEKDKLTVFNKALREEIKIKDTVISNQVGQVKLLTEQNVKMAKEVDRKKSMTTVERVIWFSLGITAAGFAVYGAKQIVQ